MTHGLHEIGTSLELGDIACAQPDEEINRVLMDQKEIVLLKKVFPAGDLDEIKSMVHAWGHSTPISPAQSALDANNFNRILELPAALQAILIKVFEPMRQLQNRITGQNAQWETDASGKKLHPQVIHYPSGGGMFAAHVHPLLPQQIGLILSISQRGRDFECGGAGFELPDGTLVDTAMAHQQSDLLIFRYDLRHWVSFVDPEEALDRSAIRGRWVMVLPYY